MADALSAWLTVREQLDWAAACALPLSTAPGPDGVAVHLDTVAEQRDPVRAARLRGALALARADADRGLPHTLLRLARWQQVVLGLPAPPRFRTGPAFAKDGRERYELLPGIARRFSVCLAEAAVPDLPAAARASRAFLDVAFFHPFADGNGRLALLILDSVLRREGLTLSAAGPLLVSRPAGDLVATAAFVRLVSLLAVPG